MAALVLREHPACSRSPTQRSAAASGG